MKIKSILAAVTVALGVSTAFADPMGSQSAVEVGKWCNNFASAKSYADANNIPMLVFWASTGCHYCEMMEQALNKSDAKEWLAASGMVLVFSYTDGTDHSNCKKFVKNKSSAYPYMAVYWKSNTKGEEVLELFSGRSGSKVVDKIGYYLGDYGASSKDALQDQLKEVVESIIPDWTAGSTVTPQPTPTPTPTPTTKYSVTFVVDSSKATVSGTLKQTVESGKAATAPTVTAKEGWKFTGWNKTFSKVTSDLTVTAKFTAVTVEPDPEPVVPGDREEVAASTVYKKARSLTAIVSDDEGIVGKATLKLAKISKKGAVKVSLSISKFLGGSATASFTATPNAYGDLVGTLPFRATMGGAMDCELTYNDGEFSLVAENETYSVEMGTVTLGGAFDTDELTFSADMSDYEPASGYDLVVEPPMGEPVYVKSGTKFSFNKIPSIKYKRIDGEYELTGTDDDVKTNVNALKLTYKSSTGVFSGSFKVYASNESYIEKGAPKLKAITVKVSGYVVDGEGIGVLKIGSKVVGTCSLN